MKINIYLYIFVMAFATWLMRVAPSLIMKKPIKDRFIQSFLYYVPYACLSAMTFPAILTSTQMLLSGVAALVVGVLLALKNKPLIVVALSASGAVLLTEWLMKLVW